MNVKCPKCLTPIQAENMNLQTSTAVCANCHHLFRLEEGWEKDEKDTKYKEIRNAPKGFKSVPTLTGMQIDIQTRKTTKGWWELWFGAVFLFAPGFILTLILTVPQPNQADNDIYLFYIILSIFAAVGGWVFWGGLTKVLNTVSIIVNAHSLEVVSTPINWGKHKTRIYPVDEIEQIFVRRYSNKSSNNKPIYEYAVDFLSTRKDKTAWIVKGLSNPESAWYLEQKLETHLNLTDKYVIGEYDPTENYSMSIKDAFNFAKQSWQNR